MAISNHFKLPWRGFHIPYHKYMSQSETLDMLIFYTDNSRNFKYAIQHISDDDAL